jgi:hypothetical protein
MMTTGLEEALKKPTVATIDGLLNDIMENFGSTKAFARQYYETLISAKHGSMIQARMMEKLIDLIRVNHQLNPDVADGDLSQHSEAELESVLAGVLKRMDSR